MRTWATPPPAAVSAPEARDTPHISDGIHHWWMMVTANVISYFTYPMLWKHQSVIWFILHMYLLKCYTMESSTSLTRIYVKLSELEMTFNFWAVRCKVWSLPWSVMLYTLWTLAEATPNNSLPISSLPEYIWKLSTLWSTLWGPPCSPTWCPP